MLKLTGALLFLPRRRHRVAAQSLVTIQPLTRGLKACECLVFDGHTQTHDLTQVLPKGELRGIVRDHERRLSLHAARSIFPHGDRHLGKFLGRQATDLGRREISQDSRPPKRRVTRHTSIKSNNRNLIWPGCAAMKADSCRAIPVVRCRK